MTEAVKWCVTAIAALGRGRRESRRRHERECGYGQKLAEHGAVYPLRIRNGVSILDLEADMNGLFSRD